MVEFGFIKQFLEIHMEQYCVVQSIEKRRPLSANVNTEKHLSKFFVIGLKSDNLSIIKVTQIINKCNFLDNNDEFFVSCWGCAHIIAA